MHHIILKQLNSNKTIQISGLILFLVFLIFLYLAIKNYYLLNQYKRGNYSTIIGLVIDKKNYYHEDGYYVNILKIEYESDSIKKKLTENFNSREVNKNVGDEVTLLSLNSNEIHMIEFYEEIKNEQKILIIVVLLLIVFIIPIVYFLFFQSSSSHQKPSGY